MASSATFSTSSFYGIVFGSRDRSCYTEVLQTCNMKSISTSADTQNSLLSSRKWVKKQLVARDLRKNSILCRAVEIERKPWFTKGNKFLLDDVIEAQQFDRDTLNAIFEVAREMENVEKGSPGSQMLKGYLMATLFYEPSTRTRLSFESAMKRLGGEVLTTENAREFSSAAKGETLEDTIRTVEGYSDIIVMRHFESGAARRAAATTNIPIINAGDGPGQHPTQALLDVYTIQREIGKLDGIKVALVGDLAYGRTVRSLAFLLAKYQDVKIYFVSPDVVKMKDDIKDYLTSQGVDWEESADLLEVASKCDVLYQTRIQRERFGERIDLYEEARGKYIVDLDVTRAMQKHAVVMHPLPRLDEIIVDVDGDPRAAYFRQAKNGLYIRMALLKLLLIGCGGHRFLQPAAVVDGGGDVAWLQARGQDGRRLSSLSLLASAAASVNSGEHRRCRWSTARNGEHRRYRWSTAQNDKKNGVA
nr:aspartate carbamoyltransferase 2, chloroplastic-like [Ipomoea batatas]